ncbi:Planctomycete cytochrome C [Prosthecobacter debontii]|uniref:Planctomycete cytochrome C n=1 Tax=Prosthecobacter debontii TaxID=48467 RepID=A0A1T4WH76_9BACT|nr:DUF1553 domain-containing protein [Prosthecobacter debontii]SKA76684.1 Planctomycete cytochrome C [Prosthecobacter debontii]
MKTLLPLAFILVWVQTRADDHTFFEQKIRPVLVEQCYSCHSAEAKKLKGNLYLDSKAGWEAGGDSGSPVIVPGNPQDSLLIRSLQHVEEGLEMPPKKPKLSDAIISDFITWVKMGAPDPRAGMKIEAKRADKSWWSLQPLREDLTQDHLDDYVQDKLAEKGLHLNPPADGRTLIRRMTYDVIGLPPTPEEVAQFAEEYARNAEAATEALVDRLLASPRYGEQWGRHWLDVVRFGESNGFERNFIIDDLWPFRDYVIRSLNDDKPFNRLIVEHLAGDVVGKDQPEIEVGSAFLVAGPYDDVGNQDPVAQKNIRAATLDDMITAAGSAFLGLTINCARCHHHKFDPIPTEDYYRMRAAFEGVKHGRRVIASREARAAHSAAVRPLNEKLAKLNERKAALDKEIEKRAQAVNAAQKPTRPKIDVHGTEENFAPVEAQRVRFVIHATTDLSPKSAVSGRLTEFQVWSAEVPKRNVALAAEGARAEGAKSATAEDFPEAYGPQLCIDGQFGEQWFIGQPATLTLTLAKPERIQGITFINARGGRELDDSKVRGATPCEYEVQVSMDGEHWQTVASDEGREPWSPAHGIAKAKRQVTRADEAQSLKLLDKEMAQIQAALKAIVPLPTVWAGTYTQPKEPTFVQQGGDPMKPTEPVQPASLKVLDQLVPEYALPETASEGERRLALARWITAEKNALTLRVLANRVWHYHFGIGLVDTPSDFGFLGSQPTHPELLDFLAQRLRSYGWRWKPLHREILLSRTYRQSGQYRQEAAQVDQEARLLWRFPPRRLTAEEVRDTFLSVAGKLQLEPMGGPGFRLYKFTQNNVCTYFPLDQHGPETWRRAVYHQNARASVVDVLNDFDLPDISFAAPRRASTTSPLQALTLLNHSFTLEMAQALAERSRGNDPVSQAFRYLFQRAPTLPERSAAEALVQSHGMAALCRGLLNSNELLYLE